MKYLGGRHKKFWLPALLIFPLHASPYFVVTYFVLTFFLPRHCLYCSALLLVLLCSSCAWASSCFLDFHGNWFKPRLIQSPLSTAKSITEQCATVNGDANDVSDAFGSFLMSAINETASSLAHAAGTGVKRKLQGKTDWGDTGVGWLRSLKEWQFRLPCVNVQVRL